MYISLEASQEPCEKHGSENAGIKDESTAEGENMGAEELLTKLADRDFLKSAFELSEMIEKLTIGRSLQIGQRILQRRAKAGHGSF